MNMQYQLLHEERLRELRRERNHEMLRLNALGMKRQRQPLRQSLRHVVLSASQKVSVLKSWVVAVRQSARPAAKPGFPPASA